MGNIPSHALHNLDELERFRPPSSLHDAPNTVIASALDLVWVAFQYQDAGRNDERVFKRRRALLQRVLKNQWDTVTEQERVGLWHDWRSFLVAVVEREIKHAGDVDLLNGVCERFKLRTLRDLYFGSPVTPSELLRRIQVIGRKSEAVEWAKDTDRWLKQEWPSASIDLKEKAVSDLQFTMEDLESGALTGEELQFQSLLYKTMPGLQGLLNRLRKDESATPPASPYIAHSLARSSPYSHRQRAIYQL
ncbi:hypothetical protein JCM6882_009394 [Rhodosporidiobolus microsporus]